MYLESMRNTVKGECEFSVEPQAQKTRRKHVEEQFARNLIRYKERLIKAKEYPEKQEDIEDAVKDIAYMQKDAELKQA